MGDMNFFKCFAGLGFAMFLLSACSEDTGKGATVRIQIETNKGVIDGRLFVEKTPVTCASFLNLAKHGYFNGLTFHRVEPNFVIQGGDPLGNGTGGPGYQFEQEIRPELKHDKAGIFSMANAGPGTNGSQFFITLRDTPHLDGGYNVFGEVTNGQQVVDAIKVGDKMLKVTVLDSTDALFQQQAKRITEWDAALKANGFLK
jgi:peptidyl-prolyl cis-trans isomerase B (cyclophilin B)